MTEREAIRKAFDNDPELVRILTKMQDSGRLGVIDLEVRPSAVIAGPNGGIVGSKQARCGCRAIVWLSPSMQVLMAAFQEPPIPLLCMRCFLKTQGPLDA